MSIRIRLASSALELERLYLARHQALSRVRVRVDGLPSPSLFDCYDTYPGIVNIIATREEQIVGGVRFLNQHETALLGSEVPGIGLNLPPDARAGSIDMFFTTEPRRDGSFLGLSMLGLGIQWALAQGLTHLYAALSGPSVELLTEAGFRLTRGGGMDDIDHDDGPLAVLDLRQLDTRVVPFAPQGGGDPFLLSSVRDYYEAGDTIVSQGELGTSCYLIGAGRVAVEVLPPGGGEQCRIAELGPGQFFGELALLTSRPRSASVVAVTDVDLMVISRQNFNNLVRTDSAIAVRLLEILGERLATTVERLAVATVSSRAYLTDGSGSNAWLGGDGCSWG